MKNKKVILSLILISILTIFSLFIFLSTPILLFRLYLYYERNHTDYVETSFLTDDIKNDIIKNSEKLTKNINKNIESIEIDSEKTIYYGTYRTLILENSTSSDMKIILEKYNISSLDIVANTENEEIYVSFIGQKYGFIYSKNNHNYKKGYVIPVGAGRVEKVIDNNWYVFRLCDRIICQEPQY